MSRVTPPYVVVLAEDEGIVRMLASEVFAASGFTVIEAAHAEEALTYLQTKAAEVDALFTDVHMPGSFNGLALAHHVHRHWPWIRLLIASGQARPTMPELPPGSRFLEKPYECERAVEHIRQMVGAVE